MSEQKIILNVQIRRDRGQENYQIPISLPQPTLMDAFKVILTQDWGSALFQEDDQGMPKVKAGILVVLNNRMIQAWDFENTILAYEDHLRFVPVVAGG